MSTLQQTKPRRANQSMTDESGRPGTCRSNVGCDAIDEPCTNRTAGLPPGEPTNFPTERGARRPCASNVRHRSPAFRQERRLAPGIVPSRLLARSREPLTSLIWVGVMVEF